eukprot:PhF_6_TR13412/c1_g1_i2/m.21352
MSKIKSPSVLIEQLKAENASLKTQVKRLEENLNTTNEVMLKQQKKLSKLTPNNNSVFMSSTLKKEMSPPPMSDIESVLSMTYAPVSPRSRNSQRLRFPSCDVAVSTSDLIDPFKLSARRFSIGAGHDPVNVNDPEALLTALSAMKRENLLLQEQLDDYLVHFPVNRQLTNNTSTTDTVGDVERNRDNNNNTLESTATTNPTSPQQLESLANQKEVFESQIMKYEETINLLKLDVLQAQSVIEAARQENSNLSSDLQHMRKEKDTLNALLDDTQEKFSNLTQELKEALEVITGLRGEKETLVKEVAFLCDALAAAANDENIPMPSSLPLPEPRVESIKVLHQHLTQVKDTLRLGVPSGEIDQLHPRNNTPDVKDNAVDLGTEGTPSSTDGPYPPPHTDGEIMMSTPQPTNDTKTPNTGEQSQAKHGTVNIFSDIVKCVGDHLREVIQNADGTVSVLQPRDSVGRLSDTFSALSESPSGNYSHFVHQINSLQSNLIQESKARVRAESALEHLREVHNNTVSRGSVMDPGFVATLREHLSKETALRTQAEKNLQDTICDRDRILSLVSAKSENSSVEYILLQEQLLQEVQARVRAEETVNDLRQQRQALILEHEGTGSQESLRFRLDMERKLAQISEERDRALRILSSATSNESGMVNSLRAELRSELKAKAEIEGALQQAREENLYYKELLKEKSSNTETTKDENLEIELERRGRLQAEALLKKMQQERDRVLNALTSVSPKDAIQTAVLRDELLKETAARTRLEQELQNFKSLQQTNCGDNEDLSFQLKENQLLRDRLEELRFQYDDVNAQKLKLEEENIQTKQERDRLSKILRSSDGSDESSQIAFLRQQLMSEVKARNHAESMLAEIRQRQSSAYLPNANTEDTESSNPDAALYDALRFELQEERAARCRLEVMLEQMRLERDRVVQFMIPTTSQSESDDPSSSLRSLREHLLQEMQARTKLESELFSVKAQRDELQRTLAATNEPSSKAELTETLAD